MLAMQSSLHEEKETRSRGTGLSWFWIGSSLGLVLSALAVVTSLEFARRRRRRAVSGYEQDEDDLIEDLSGALQDGVHVLARAAGELRHSFVDARRELVRYGLEPGRTGAGSSGWYTGDEE